jgi:hypothetical protein
LAVCGLQGDDEDADGDWAGAESKPPRRTIKSVPTASLMPSIKKELPAHINPEDIFPGVLYFKDEEKGENLMHKMTARDKANLKKLFRLYRCASYRTHKCPGVLRVEVSGNQVDYIMKGGHNPECTRLNGISIHNVDTLGDDWMVGMPLDEKVRAKTCA